MDNLLDWQEREDTVQATESVDLVKVLCVQIRLCAYLHANYVGTDPSMHDSKSMHLVQDACQRVDRATSELLVTAIGVVFPEHSH